MMKLRDDAMNKNAAAQPTGSAQVILALADEMVREHDAITFHENADDIGAEEGDCCDEGAEHHKAAFQAARAKLQEEVIELATRAMPPPPPKNPGPPKDMSRIEADKPANFLDVIFKVDADEWLWSAIATDPKRDRVLQMVSDYDVAFSYRGVHATDASERALSLAMRIGSLAWIVRGGRGSGKTFYGAGWIVKRIHEGDRLLAVVGPNPDAVAQMRYSLLLSGLKDDGKRMRDAATGAVVHMFDAAAAADTWLTEARSCWVDELEPDSTIGRHVRKSCRGPVMFTCGPERRSKAG